MAVLARAFPSPAIQLQRWLLGKIFRQCQTVIRGGYGRIYGRLNGVDLVLIPLLGTGLGQAVSCLPRLPVLAGVPLDTSATAFRIGTNGLLAPLPAVSQTLPQPYFPGTNGYASAGSGSVLDPNFRPSSTDNFQFSIQRELKKNLILEVGYIGRKINHEWQQVDLDAVPYMTTLTAKSLRALTQMFTPLSSRATRQPSSPSLKRLSAVLVLPSAQRRAVVPQPSWQTPQ